MSKPQKIRAVRGMNDILPADEALWNHLEESVASTMLSYGYRRIRTPIVEPTGLFVRGIGEVTDIVEKEMYSFEDSLNGDALTLRPENTAGVVRASIEHNLTYDGPQRLWYSGPMFRHERPQKGRYRQFHQVGAEFFGVASAQADAELIMLGQRLWDDLGLEGVKLQINCLGQSAERQAHRSALITYFEAHKDQLDDDAVRRLHSNPLRILDTKNPAMQALVEEAPSLIEHLGVESLAHFEQLQALLRSQNMPFEINPRLVRGLDYYNLTVFEWVAGGLTLCGGGRYDPLIEMLGGKPSHGCGWALGVERVLELLREQHAMTPVITPDVYVVQFGGSAGEAAFQAAERMRDIGLDVTLHCGGGSPKSQFKRADASGAVVAVIIGDDEAEQGRAGVKPLRDREAEQSTVAIEDLPEAVMSLIVGQFDQDDDDPAAPDDPDATGQIPPTHH
ncbi:MAG: histidine--tRNA ligase [Burkholderiaceae bacterium]